MAGEGHASFRIQGSAKVEGGEEGGGQVAERLGGGLDLRGYAGPGQLMVSGTVGDGEKVELRMAGKQLAIQQRGRWYAGQVGSLGRPDALSVFPFRDGKAKSALDGPQVFRPDT